MQQWKVKKKIQEVVFFQEILTILIYSFLFIYYFFLKEVNNNPQNVFYRTGTVLWYSRFFIRNIQQEECYNNMEK